MHAGIESRKRSSFDRMGAVATHGEKVCDRPAFLCGVADIVSVFWMGCF